MAVLRDLSGRIALDVRKALAGAKAFDVSMDEAQRGIGETERETKDLGRTLDKGAKKSESFGRKLSRAFANAGQAAFQSRGKIGGALKGIGGAFAGARVIAAGATGVIGALTLEWAKQAEQIDITAKRYEIATTEFQKLTGAAKQVGVEADVMGDAIKDMTERMGEAQFEAASPLKEALFQLGLSLNDLKTKGPTEQMGILADALNNLDDHQQRLFLGTEIFAEAFNQLQPLLLGGSEAINRLSERTEAMGGVMDAVAIKAGVGLRRSFGGLQAQLNVIRNEVAQKLEPAFTKLIKTASKYITKNKEMIAVRVTDFLERLVRLTVEFIPLLVRLADGTLKFIEGLGGIDGAATTLIGTLGLLRIASLAALGPAGPIIAGIGAAILLLDTLDRRFDASIAQLDRLADKRRKSEDVDKPISDADRLASGEKGLKLQLLQDRRVRLKFLREQTGIESFTGTIDELESLSKAAGVTGKSGVSGGTSLENKLRAEDLRARFEQAKRLERALDENTQEIRKQRAVVKDAIKVQKFLTGKFDDVFPELASVSDAAETASKLSGEELKQFQILARLFQAGKTTDAEERILRALAKKGDIEVPGTPKKPGKPKKEKEEKDPEQTIRELVGLGPEGLAKISQLVPQGQGTTINNFDFRIAVAGADVDITVIAASGQSALEIAQETSNIVGTTISDQAHADQRELIGQVQG